MTALLPVAGCAAGSSPRESVPRISVAFVEPEKFTDARRAEMEPTSSEILRELNGFFIETHARYIPRTMRLNVRFTDINLAGDFEAFRGPQADQLRITRGLYPPRVVLEFELLDRQKKVIRAGKRTLTDIDYQTRSVDWNQDYLRYEKNMLREWLRAEFADVRNATAG
jgi:hypothetical protein